MGKRILVMGGFPFQTLIYSLQKTEDTILLPAIFLP